MIWFLFHNDNPNQSKINYSLLVKVVLELGSFQRHFTPRLGQLRVLKNCYSSLFSTLYLCSNLRLPATSFVLAMTSTLRKPMTLWLAMIAAGRKASSAWRTQQRHRCLHKVNEVTNNGKVKIMTSCSKVLLHDKFICCWFLERFTLSCYNQYLDKSI